MRRRCFWWVGTCTVGAIVFALSAGAGCQDRGGGGISSLPEELVVWGDPEPGGDAAYVSVRDLNDVDDRFVVIGTNGLVQFSIGKVCDVCEVQGPTIYIDGTPRIDIRFGPGPDGEGDRRPYLVSTNGFYIELVSEKDSVTFQVEDVAFEEPDDPSDDLAERVGTIPNPAARTKRNVETSKRRNVETSKRGVFNGEP